MLYRGARVAGADYFDDLNQEGQENPGIFKGGGLSGYEGVSEYLGPEGIEVKMQCRQCGRECIVTLEWEELFVCGSNGPGLSLLLPNGWRYSENNGTMYSANQCRCGAKEGFCPHVTPDECRRHVQAAIARGLVSRQQALAWKAKVDQYRGGGGGGD
jgi:hypothetical protein